MNIYTKSFWGRSSFSISEEINKYIENCDSPVRISAMTTITGTYDDKFVIVAFEKI